MRGAKRYGRCNKRRCGNYCQEEAGGETDRRADSDRLEDLGLESLDAVEMIFDLEEKFDIEIPYNANTNNPRTEFETVGDVVKSIQKLVDKKS